jgi:hypothetical protein
MFSLPPVELPMELPVVEFLGFVGLVGVEVEPAADFREELRLVLPEEEEEEPEATPFTFHMPLEIPLPPPSPSPPPPPRVAFEGEVEVKASAPLPERAPQPAVEREVVLKVAVEAPESPEVEVVERPKVEAVVERPKVEAGVVERPKVEAGVVEPPKKVEAGVVEPPKKVEAGVVERPKVEAAVVEPPKKVEVGVVERPKVEVLEFFTTEAQRPRSQDAEVRVERVERVEVVARAEPVQQRAPAAVVREIAIQLPGLEAKPVAVHVVERRGKVQVEVLTDDPRLAESLRANSGELVERLQGQGYTARVEAIEEIYAGRHWRQQPHWHPRGSRARWLDEEIERQKEGTDGDQ